MSAQEVADAAAGVPLNGHVRPELVPLPEQRVRAADRALPGLQRAPGGGDGRARAGAGARALRDGDRGRGAARLGRRVRALPADRRGLRGARRPRRRDRRRPRADRARPVDRRVAARAARPPRRGSRATCGTLRRDRPDGRDHARSTTRPARTRSSRTPSATCSAARPRRTAARACTRPPPRWRRPTRSSTRCARVLAKRGALAPVETGLLRLRRELAAIRRAHGGELAGARRAQPRPSASGSTAGSAPAWNCSPAPARARDQLPAHDPGAAAVKVNRRRFLAGRRSRSAPSPPARPSRRGAERRPPPRAALGPSGSRSTGRTRPACSTEPRDAVVLAALDAIAPDRDELVLGLQALSGRGRASSPRASRCRSASPTSRRWTRARSAPTSRRTR